LKHQLNAPLDAFSVLMLGKELYAIEEDLAAVRLLQTRDAACEG
jgi:hypothetical protein